MMKTSWKERAAKAVRVVTTAPVFALLLCVLTYFLVEGAFASWQHCAMAIFFLTGLPLLAYPVSYALPALRRRGRSAQRNTAILFSVVGYVGGFLYAVFAGGTGFERVLLGTYLVSGIALALCTVGHYKASGHACGCSGPVAMLSLFISPWFLLGYVLLTPVIWSSLRLKRHTPWQLIAGAVIPVLAMFLCRAQFL